MSDKKDELEGFEGKKERPEQGQGQSQSAPKKDDLEGFEAVPGKKEEPKPAEAAPKAPDAPAKAAAPKPAAVPDTYTEVEEVRKAGFGEKLQSSVQGVLIGFILFLASFFILYKGETRVDRSEIVAKAAAVQPDDSAKTAEGKTVKFSGKAATTAPVTDPDYLADGKFVYLARTAEMYAWTEKSESKTEPGSSPSTEKKVTTYRYEKEWTSSPADSSRFKKPEGHSNPPMTIESKKWIAKPVTVGTLTVDLGAARVMGGEAVSAPAAPTPPKAFDPNAPEGSGPVTFTGAPAVATPVEVKVVKDKKLLLYVIEKETFDEAGDWKAGEKTVHVAEGITVGKIKIATAGLKAENLPQLGDMLYKPASAATAPMAGSERATVRGIEVGAAVAFSGTLAGDTLTNVTVSGKAAAAEAPAVSKNPWYIGKGAPSAPEVGDIRLSFTAIRPDSNLFICGKLQGGSVGPTTYKGVSFMVAALTNEDQVMADLRSEHTTWVWVARIGGFLCMWIGMCLMVGPLTFLVGYIPVVGSLAGGMVQVVFGIIALVLSVLTILLVKFFWALLVIALAVVIWAIVKSRQAKPAAS